MSKNYIKLALAAFCAFYFGNHDKAMAEELADINPSVINLDDSKTDEQKIELSDAVKSYISGNFEEKEHKDAPVVSENQQKDSSQKNVTVSAQKDNVNLTKTENKVIQSGKKHTVVSKSKENNIVSKTGKKITQSVKSPVSVSKKTETKASKAKIEQNIEKTNNINEQVVQFLEQYHNIYLSQLNNVSVIRFNNAYDIKASLKDSLQSKILSNLNEKAQLGEYLGCLDSPIDNDIQNNISNDIYEIVEGSESNYNYTTVEDSVTKYWKISIKQPKNDLLNIAESKGSSIYNRLKQFTEDKISLLQQNNYFISNVNEEESVNVLDNTISNNEKLSNPVVEETKTEDIIHIYKKEIRATVAKYGETKVLTYFGDTVVPEMAKELGIRLSYVDGARYRQGDKGGHGKGRKIDVSMSEHSQKNKMIILEKMLDNPLVASIGTSDEFLLKKHANNPKIRDLRKYDSDYRKKHPNSKMNHINHLDISLDTAYGGTEQGRNKIVNKNATLLASDK